MDASLDNQRKKEGFVTFFWTSSYIELCTMPLSEEGDTQSSLCLEWKQLNYSVPAQEQSNYSFWNECRKQSELRILHDGKFYFLSLSSRSLNVECGKPFGACSIRSIRLWFPSFIAVSGHLKTGDLIAILGGSGAGKTTLLAAISQRLRGNLTGDVVLNGLAMDRHQMTRISSFLPQFEINVKTFTAYEHLYFMVGVTASLTPASQLVSLFPVSLQDASPHNQSGEASEGCGSAACRRPAGCSAHTHSTVVGRRAKAS